MKKGKLIRILSVVVAGMGICVSGPVFAEDIIEIGEKFVLYANGCPDEYQEIDLDGDSYPDVCRLIGLHVQTGKVGIGTSTPSAPLNVKGESTLDTDSVVARFEHGHESGGGLEIRTRRDLQSGYRNYAVIQSKPNDAPNDGTSTRYLILNSDGGNVGVGTTTPNSRLAVSGLSSAPPSDETTTGILCITSSGSIWVDTSRDSNVCGFSSP